MSSQRGYDRARGSVIERGYGAGWRRIRERVLSDEPFCRRCGVEGVEVDHIVPRSLGGADDRQNLQTLCTACHNRKTAEERVGRRVG